MRHEAYCGCYMTALSHHIGLRHIGPDLSITASELERAHALLVEHVRELMIRCVPGYHCYLFAGPTAWTED
jgi:hypothetical protein